MLDNGVILPSEYSDDWYDDMTSNLTKLDEVIGSNAEKLSASDVGAAAISNDYDDLDDKPAYNILRRASVTLTAGGTGNYTDLDSDSKIKAGDYVLDAANKLYSITAIDAANSTYTVSAAALINITDKSELGAAALSNSYDDLSNLPGYGILRFCSTAITDNSSVPFANISSVSKIAAGDFLLDTAAKLYQIASIDTANETVAVTTPVTRLALDANVMHLSGNETVDGNKIFEGEIISASNIVVSPASTYVTGIKDKKLIDKNLFNILNERVTYNNSRNVRYTWTISNKDSNGNTISSGVQLALSAVGQAYFYPINDNDMFFGASTAYIKGVYTKLINSLTPSSLSMPTDNIANIIDISGFLTVLDGSQLNTYQAPVNGYIGITMSNCTGIQAYITGFWGNQIVRPTAGALRFFMPICQNMTANILVFGGTVDNARFFPCQGTV